MRAFAIYLFISTLAFNQALQAQTLQRRTENAPAKQAAKPLVISSGNKIKPSLLEALPKAQVARERPKLFKDNKLIKAPLSESRKKQLAKTVLEQTINAISDAPLMNGNGFFSLASPESENDYMLTGWDYNEEKKIYSCGVFLAQQQSYSIRNEGQQQSSAYYHDVKLLLAGRIFFDESGTQQAFVPGLFEIYKIKDNQETLLTNNPTQAGAYSLNGYQSLQSWMPGSSCAWLFGWERDGMIKL